jgi:hypothetical protein
MSWKLIAVTSMLAFTSIGAMAQDGKPAKGELRSACTDDIKKFCASTPKGKGNIRTCLKTHEADLADTCKTALANREKS